MAGAVTLRLGRRARPFHVPSHLCAVSSMYRFLAFFGLDALVKPVAVPPPLQHSAAEGVHDQHVIVANDVLLQDTKRTGEKACVPFDRPQQAKRLGWVGGLVGGWMSYVLCRAQSNERLMLG